MPLARELGRGTVLADSLNDPESLRSKVLPVPAWLDLKMRAQADFVVVEPA